jgi:hypothetical protein
MRRVMLMGCLGGVLLLAIGLVVLAWVMVNPAKPRPRDVSATVDAENLRRHVGALTGLGGYRSFEYPEVLDRAAEYIRHQWMTMGFDVSEQPYEVAGTTYRNLLAGFGPGAAPLIVVGAHYDVCGDQDGADDNGSAVAALLELSRILASERPPLQRRIEMVAFTLEEPPFFRTDGMGSAVHLQSLRQRGARVEAMICLEMLGYFSDAPRSQSFPVPGLGLLYPRTGNFIAVVGNFRGRRLTREVKSSMAGTCAVPVHSINAPSIVPGVDFSDHVNYWRAGIPAVMITDTAFYRNPNYHLPSDTADTLDFDRAAEVVKGLYAALVALGS